MPQDEDDFSADEDTKLPEGGEDAEDELFEEAEKEEISPEEFEKLLRAVEGGSLIDPRTSSSGIGT